MSSNLNGEFQWHRKSWTDESKRLSYFQHFFNMLENENVSRLQNFIEKMANEFFLSLTLTEELDYFIYPLLLYVRMS